MTCLPQPKNNLPLSYCLVCTIVINKDTRDSMGGIGQHLPTGFGLKLLTHGTSRCYHIKHLNTCFTPYESFDKAETTQLSKDNLKLCGLTNT